VILHIIGCPVKLICKKNRSIYIEQYRASVMYKVKCNSLVWTFKDRYVKKLVAIHINIERRKEEQDKIISDSCNSDIKIYRLAII